MKYSSMIFAFALSVFSIIVIYNFFHKLYHNTLPNQVNYWPDKKLLTLKNMTIALPIAIFAFTF